ncbi:sensor histidine kinase [Streptomyces sp. NPDC058653]|uniref:sensor histidine kinase n=1 Tax=Streptomyces sp. NPDC058653 TaxID=3346576 RepID=UPI00364B1D26
MDSPLLEEPQISALLVNQVHLLLDDIARGARTGFGSRTAPSQESLTAAAEFSRTRASRGIHPTETVRAAELFFEMALPVVVHEYLPATPSADEFLDTALTLNDAVMTQIALGCVGYIKFLREKLHSSHIDERRRLARDLHDRVAHEVLVAMLELELCEPLIQSESAVVRSKLKSAEEALKVALREIGDLSGELRESVSDTNLEQALTKFLEFTVPDRVRAELTVTGNVDDIPAAAAEELYFIIREAARNALRHSGPDELWISLRITETLVQASVIDDGAGFEVASLAAKTRRGGLISIRERAELLGGNAGIHSSVGGGTTVNVSIPLVNWRRHD